MGPGRRPRRGMDDSGAPGEGRAGPRGGRRASGSPPPRRRCSSARSGSVLPAGARAPHGRPQRGGGEVAPATRAGRLMRRTLSRSSRSTSAWPTPTRAARATTTRSTPGAGALSSRRKLSRSSRRARFRSTAPPTRRLTARPRRSKARPFAAATSRKRRPSRRAPRLKAASNSFPVRSRWRGRKRTGLTPVARASGGDPLPALLSAALQDELAPLRPHADQEAVGALAAAVVRLERPLHRGNPIGPAPGVSARRDKP
jgi:hypothetical protein